MTDPARPPRRVAVVDALRALALLPVVLVNWVGYASLPAGGPLTTPIPSDSGAAQALTWLLYALVAGKGISLLAFLFGYSQALSQRRRDASDEAHRRTRLQRLLVLGLLHGCLLYMGDILTTYAVCGWLLLQWADLPMRRLLRRLRVVAALNLVVIGVVVVLSQVDLSSGPAVSLSQPASWAEWTLRNGGNYLAVMFAMLLLGLPLPMTLMTAGLVCGRLRLFSHPRWRPALARWAKRWLLPAVAVNVAWASLLWPGLRDGSVLIESRFAIYYLYPTMLLLSAAVPALALLLARSPTWTARIAPLGRHTLTLYLLSSVVSWAVFSGAGLSWQGGTVLTAVLALLYWAGGLAVARWLGPRRLPLERWLSAR